MDLSAANFRGERKNVRLESLIRDPRLQGREDPSLVKKHAGDVAEAVKAGADIDPIFVVRLTAPDVTADGKKVEPGDYVCDGHRRCLGYEMAGRAAISALVRVGTWKDAVDVASSANYGNVTLTRTNEDKHRQVLMSFANHPDRSLRWHSEHCRVSNELPTKLWPAFEKTLPKDVVERIKTEGRVGKSGKKQSATKKKVKKAPSAASGKVADWKGYEASYNFITRFVDHVAELDGYKSTPAKAHKMHKEFGDFMMEWKGEIQRRADDAAAKARAAADAAREKEAEAKKTKAATNPFGKEDESAKGKE